MTNDLVSDTGVGLLILDMQQDLIQAARAEGESDLGIEAMIAAIRSLRDCFDDQRWPVIYTRVCYRASYIDAPESAPARSRNSLQEGELGSMIIPELAPRPTDFMVIKRRFGAFYGTDLEILIRGLGLKELIVTGISTPRAVESTVREAHSRDIKCVVVSDATYAPTTEDQQHCMEIMGKYGIARIAGSDDVRAAFARAH